MYAEVGEARIRLMAGGDKEEVIEVESAADFLSLRDSGGRDKKASSIQEGCKVDRMGVLRPEVILSVVIELYVDTECGALSSRMANGKATSRNIAKGFHLFLPISPEHAWVPKACMLPNDVCSLAKLKRVGDGRPFRAAIRSRDTKRQWTPASPGDRPNQDPIARIDGRTV